MYMHHYTSKETKILLWLFIYFFDLIKIIQYKDVGQVTLSKLINVPKYDYRRLAEVRKD